MLGVQFGPVRFVLAEKIYNLSGASIFESATDALTIFC